MRQWFQAKFDEVRGDVKADTVLKHLCQVVFKHTLPVPEDTWPHPEPGEDTALRMQDAIARREQWLWDKCLPLDTLMNDEQRKDFLTELKKEYADTPLQRTLHADDLDKKRQGGERRRWCRELQRRCGSKQLWELVSFSGCWDPSFLEGALSKAGSAAPPVAVAAAVRKRALTTAAL